MQAAMETSKKQIVNQSELDFVREIEMWCSLFALVWQSDPIHHTIDFAETKSVRWSSLRTVGPRPT
jgi:hypothetical protein